MTFDPLTPLYPLPSPVGRLRLDKTLGNAVPVLAAVRPGSTLAVGCSGLRGTPMALIETLHATGVDDLMLSCPTTAASTATTGPGHPAVRPSNLPVIASYVGDNKKSALRYLARGLEAATRTRPGQGVVGRA